MKTIVWLFLLLVTNHQAFADADLSVDIRLFQSRVITGDLAKMEITIRNQGPDSATGVKLDLAVTQGLFSDHQQQQCAVGVSS